MPHLRAPDRKFIEDNETVKTLYIRMVKRESRSEQTVKRYLDGIKRFTEFMAVDNPDAALDAFSKVTNKTHTLDKFIDTLMDLTPINLKANWFGVKKWLITNEMNEGINWDFLARPMAVSNIQDRIAKKNELQRILDNKVCLRDKAFYLTMISAGFRVGTLATLQVKDYKPVEELGMITVWGGAGRKLAVGRVYYTFLTPEARRVLDEYLSTRGTLNPNDYLFCKEVKGKGLPFSYGSNISRQWTKLVKRAGLLEKIPNTRAYTLHAHTLRKYFQTNCKLVCKANFVDFWMGHHPTKSENYLDESYFRPELEKHLAEYRKAVPALTIFEQGINAEKLDELEKSVKARDEIIEVINQKLDLLLPKEAQSYHYNLINMQTGQKESGWTNFKTIDDYVNFMKKYGSLPPISKVIPLKELVVPSQEYLDNMRKENQKSQKEKMKELDEAIKDKLRKETKNAKK